MKLGTWIEWDIHLDVKHQQIYIYIIYICICILLLSKWFNTRFTGKSVAEEFTTRDCD
jgi:preprotein translocase subunit SecY